MISEKVDEPFINQQHLDELERLRTHIDEETGIKATHEEGILHPVEIIESMQKVLTDDTVTVKYGSHYIWMARNFRSYNPRHLLFSNGMPNAWCSITVGNFSCTCVALIRKLCPLLAMVAFYFHHKI